MTFTSYITDVPNPVIAIPGTLQAGPFIELQQSMASRTVAISPFIDQLMRFINIFRVADDSYADVEIALREAITNAVIHGNKNDESKCVDVVCRCGIDGEVFVTVRDQGVGFDFESVPDPTTSDNLLSTHGRGIYLMHALMDKVHFEDGGAVVQLRKRAGSPKREREERTLALGQFEQRADDSGAHNVAVHASL
jgi:serine/threonine-protein kinase RsbW